MDYNTVDIFYLEHSSGKGKKKKKKEKKEMQLLMPSRQRRECISTHLVCLPRRNSNHRTFHYIYVYPLVGKDEQRNA